LPAHSLPSVAILELIKGQLRLEVEIVSGQVRDGEIYNRQVELDSARIGIEIEEMVGHGVRVKDVVVGGAAAKSGQVRIGDHIIRINGVDVSQVGCSAMCSIVSPHWAHSDSHSIPALGFG
jgi:C-terminal processing protease CtpA/Prc